MVFKAKLENDYMKVNTDNLVFLKNTKLHGTYLI
jgi:hypothetical protein